MTNAFTVDVEEWFHVCGVGGALAPARWHELESRVVDDTRRLIDLAARCGVRGTFFVLGWVAQRHPELVGEIVRAGHQVGSHGQTHTRVYELGGDAFSAELDASRAALEGAGAPDVRAFRAPEWSINDRTPWALERLARAGFTIDSSMAPLRVIGNPAYPQAPHVRHTAAGAVGEYPPFVARWLGQQVPQGGGWGLRLSRPAAALRAIDARNRAGVPITLWVHPWELDPNPPRVRLPWTLWVAHYAGLPGFASRLAEVLSNAAFAPLPDTLPALAP
jgi:polysaccharide deacetylase family protein (PEP-CTERM system associated)